ncbi:MAG: filamentous hemagglutinin N-terminal domain-containing protein [Simkaniaceae bacterium]|nr:filamentous hemagglutinin N-terminal domain-containing protein [Candidatus Sacchlamyda saccharinae]
MSLFSGNGIILCFLLPLALFAKPKGHVVERGTATVKESGSLLEIQTSDRAIINWEEFSIANGEVTRFVQPNTSSAVLNRISGAASQIDGLLEANGHVYLLNPKGVIIGPSGNVCAESFIASTLDFDSEDFFKNRELLFSGNSEGKIINAGKISALGGDVFLLAKAVVNTGKIKGEVVGLAAGEEILLKPSGSQRLFISRKANGKGDGGVENAGLIEATTAELRADGNAFRFAINQAGTIEANVMKQEGGRVFLVADGGTVSHSGTIAAPAGTVHILGEQVGLHEGAKIDASSDWAGGEVLVGGDFQGANPEILNAEICVLMEGAEISADALLVGDGGQIVLWSDEATVMEGRLSVQGGLYGGDGGMMEVSSADNLVFNGFVSGDAPMGSSGQLLLDPSEVAVDNFGQNSGVSFDPATGFYTPTGPMAAISSTVAAESLQNVLQNGDVDITIVTTSSFDVPGTLDVVEPIFWSTNNNLTLIADNDILFADGVVENTGDASVFVKGRDIKVISFIVTSGIRTNSGQIIFEAERDIEIITPVPPSGPSILESTSGTISLSAGRNFMLGGFESPQDGCIISSVSGPVAITTGNDFNIFGSTKPSETMIIDVGEQGGKGTFTVGGDMLLMSGSAANTPVFIGHQGISSGDINISVEGDIKLSGGDAHIGTDQSTGSVLAIAGESMTLESGTSILSGNGEITLVVDNNAPEPPEIGDGRFILDSGASVGTSGAVRIFTAKRSQNSINAPINGVVFVPGQQFINSETEQWGEYFPEAFGGFPFTIFYKTSFLQSLFTNNGGRAHAEMFQNLQTYDEFLFSLNCFLFGYDSACYNQLTYPRGMVSSFDLFGEETRFMLRQKYRNYHTKYVESF